MFKSEDPTPIPVPKTSELHEFLCRGIDYSLQNNCEELFTALSSAKTILEDLQLKKAKSAPLAEIRDFFAKQ